MQCVANQSGGEGFDLAVVTLCFIFMKYSIGNLVKRIIGR